MPILLGGDHCLGIGSITAVARALPRAQARNCACSGWTRTRISTPATITPSGNIHGMPVACLCGLRPGRTDHDWAAARRRSTPEQIRQIGIRSVDRGEKRLVQDVGLDIYDMRYIDEVGMKRVMEEALDGVDDDTHLHVSFDVDFLDPAIAPGVGTTVPGRRRITAKRSW